MMALFDRQIFLTLDRNSYLCMLFYFAAICINEKGFLLRRKHNEALLFSLDRNGQLCFLFNFAAICINEKGYLLK